jgi:acyl phosphate:glycerol-3-phosphate acyltransferase
MPDPISWSEALPFFTAALFVSYLLGSIPFGLIFTRIAGLGDIRDIGSGNIGATNALRTGNRWVAGGTFLGDMGKGALAVLLARQFGPDVAVIAGFGALVGHLFPVWLKFNGGKGISTYIGILLALAWPVGLLFCATWLAVALTFRMSSLSALVASLLSPVYFAWFDQWQMVELSVVLVLLVFFAHRENIARLLAGTEPRIGNKDGT